MTKGKIHGASGNLVGLGASIIADVPVFRMFTVRVPQDKLPELVALPFIQWAEYIAPPNVLEKIVAKIPVGRLGKAEEIARGVLFLVGDDAGFVTGSTMSINGGQHMY